MKRIFLMVVAAVFACAIVTPSSETGGRLAAAIIFPKQAEEYRAIAYRETIAKEMVELFKPVIEDMLRQSGNGRKGAEPLGTNREAIPAKP